MVKYAIIVEGKSDKKFIGLLIEHMFELSVKQVQFYIMRGKSNFFDRDYIKYRELLQNIEAEQVEKVLFILDADSIKSDKKYGNYTNTQQEITKVLEDIDIAENSDFYISCDPQKKTGCLESLILSTIPLIHKNWIETFLKCSDFKSKNNAKTILNQIYHQAYPSVSYDFSHKNFNELKAKLTALFSEE